MKKTDLEKLYFHINGSGSPFWKEEKKMKGGKLYYWELYWPENTQKEFDERWREIRILHSEHNNPIDLRFPSFWNISMCELYNEKVKDFFVYSKSVLTNYKLINRVKPLEVDKKFNEYKLDPIKYHLGFNKSFDSKKEFISFLNENQETESKLTSNNIDYYQRFEISVQDYYSFNRVFLNFGNYKSFRIAFCPFSNKTFLAIINSGGHFPCYEAMRIDRKDIVKNQKKILKYSKNYLRDYNIG